MPWAYRQVSDGAEAPSQNPFSLSTPSQARNKWRVDSAHFVAPYEVLIEFNGMWLIEPLAGCLPTSLEFHTSSFACPAFLWPIPLAPTRRRPV